jgi:spermidine/putrescine transport system permease protein
VNKLRSFVREEFPFIAAMPAILWQVIFLIVPVAIMVFKSFLAEESCRFTLENYYKIFSSPYLRSILNSHFLAAATVFFCLLVSFPIANFIAFNVKKNKTLMLVLLMLPSWTNFIVRIYSWFLLFKSDGLISRLLSSCGLIGSTSHLIGSFSSVIVGMVYCYLPFMVLPVYSALCAIDSNIVEASADLGATRWQTLRKIIIPMAMPGIISGAVLVYLFAFGEFAIPGILGAGKYAYWGDVVQDRFLLLRDFRSGAALTVMGVSTLVFPLLAVYLSQWAIKFLLRNKRFFKLNIISSKKMSEE